ncbi:MAG TPA: DUF4270 family protein [Fluviicola sp.]|nr:DUF4270 family protein [Fluviicola sp.]
MMNQKNILKSWREVFILSACFLIAVGFITSCKKKSTSLGAEVLNVDDLLAAGGIDTFNLISYSVDEDSIPTDYQAYGTLGCYHDPKLGVFNASIYTQLNIGGKTTLPSGSVLDQIDSVVLSLSYSGSYGNLGSQTFQVHELSDKLYIDSTYYRFSTKNTTGIDLVEASSATQTPNTKKYVYVGPNGEDSLKPQLRLRLNNTLGQQFVQDIIAGNSAFNTSSDFLSSGYFKGFKILVSNTNPAQNTGAILYMNMASTETKLAIYFKLQGDTTQKQIELKLVNNATYFNHVDKDFTGHHVAQVLSDKTYGQTNFYAQRFGLLGAVEFPTLTNISSKSVISNCLLHLPVASYIASPYTPCTTLELYFKNDAGNYSIITSASYSETQKGYVFDLRPFAQDIVAGKFTNRPVYIFPSTNLISATADRVVFNGASTAYKTKPKLVLKYTEFK